MAYPRPDLARVHLDRASGHPGVLRGRDLVQPHGLQRAAEQHRVVGEAERPHLRRPLLRAAGVRVEGAEVGRQVREVPLLAREAHVRRHPPGWCKGGGRRRLRGRKELALHKGHGAVAVEVVQREAAGRVKRRGVLGGGERAVGVGVGEDAEVVLLEGDAAGAVEVLLRHQARELPVRRLPHEARIPAAVRVAAVGEAEHGEHGAVGPLEGPAVGALGRDRGVARVDLAGAVGEGAPGRVARAGRVCPWRAGHGRRRAVARAVGRAALALAAGGVLVLGQEDADCVCDEGLDQIFVLVQAPERSDAQVRDKPIVARLERADA
mmetsp:Transcript_52503/g.109577  ORF Transcript_52503/g.109577 Transcript_52503/m.109577 type:complete len:322 (+) Transcript_52503:1894-2859(+)